jgi:hypothetical protein
MVALTQSRTQPPETDRVEIPHGYRVFWRLRSTSPWRREEFESRAAAHDRFFQLMRKGLELRWGSV